MRSTSRSAFERSAVLVLPSVFCGGAAAADSAARNTAALRETLLARFVCGGYLPFAQDFTFVLIWLGLHGIKMFSGVVAL